MKQAKKVLPPADVAAERQAKIIREENEARISYSEAEIKIKYILGKVLTILEASALNQQQCQAVKSLVKHVFSEELTKLYNWTIGSAQMLTEAEMVDENGSMEQFYRDNMPTDLPTLVPIGPRTK